MYGDGIYYIVQSQAEHSADIDKMCQGFVQKRALFQYLDSETGPVKCLL